jgi:hypothetical protein
MNYELKHIRGIPYYLNGSAVYTFELDAGKPSPHCVPLGTYDADKDVLTYLPDWRERLQSRLDAFRGSLLSHARDTLRDNVKPQKQRKATRTPRKTAASRAASAASE